MSEKIIESVQELIGCSDIVKIVQEQAKQIYNQYGVGENLLIVPVLDGACIFAADLIRELANIGTSEFNLAFIKAKSYEGTKSTGNVEISGLSLQEVWGKDILLVEDIVETGLTLDKIVMFIKQCGAKSVRICTLLAKPKCLKSNVVVDFCGQEIEDNFVVGYGMDYNGIGRGLKDVCIFNGEK